jgi:hypothetical protein
MEGVGMNDVRRLRALVAGAALALAAFLPATAGADSTPVGSLPKPAVTSLSTTRGSLVSVALPSARPATGLVWRIARPLDARKVRQVGEADVGRAVVLVFRVVGVGRTSIVLAQTHGETSTRAVRAVRYDLRVR